MSLRHLRRTLQERLYRITGWWMSKKDATTLVMLLHDLPTKLVEQLEMDVDNGKIKRGQHTNYYKIILWKRMNEYLSHPDTFKSSWSPGKGAVSVKEVLDKIFKEESVGVAKPDSKA